MKEQQNKNGMFHQKLVNFGLFFFIINILKIEKKYIYIYTYIYIILLYYYIKKIKKYNKL